MKDKGSVGVFFKWREKILLEWQNTGSVTFFKGSLVEIGIADLWEKSYGLIISDARGSLYVGLYLRKYRIYLVSPYHRLLRKNLYFLILLKTKKK